MGKPILFLIDKNYDELIRLKKLESLTDLVKKIRPCDVLDIRGFFKGLDPRIKEAYSGRSKEFVTDLLTGGGGFGKDQILFAAIYGTSRESIPDLVYPYIMYGRTKQDGTKLDKIVPAIIENQESIRDADTKDLLSRLKTEFDSSYE